MKSFDVISCISFILFVYLSKNWSSTITQWKSLRQTCMTRMHGTNCSKTTTNCEKTLGTAVMLSSVPDLDSSNRWYDWSSVPPGQPWHVGSWAPGCVLLLEWNLENQNSSELIRTHHSVSPSEKFPKKCPSSTFWRSSDVPIEVTLKSVKRDRWSLHVCDHSVRTSDRTAWRLCCEGIILEGRKMTKNLSRSPSSGNFSPDNPDSN